MSAIFGGQFTNRLGFGAEVRDKELSRIAMLHFAAIWSTRTYMARLPEEDRRPVRLTTNVSTESARKLNAIAKAQRVKVSWLIARAVDQFLERSEAAEAS